ncbi:MAG TPA: SRPBCC domain-containing protein [Kofleriaceae bacterium]|nr:SRPBCC domain-containing protein [Kofleriaceae bacterium]
MTAALRAARSIADLDAGTILATVDIAAPPERVFRALTTEEITRWWGSADRHQVTKFTADLRVGGRWRSEGHGKDGAPFSVEGEYVVVDPPRLLVHTWVAPWDGGNTTTVSYTLDAIDGGTRVTLRHDGFADRRDSCRDHGDGWPTILDWLAAFVAPRADRFFFVRLIAPRPTFLQDMTADERAAMIAHGAYWRGHLDAGAAIVFGPVLDPAGGWGLGVLRAADEAAVRAFEAKDPAHTQLGMRYEILPMLRAVFRD